MGGQNIPSMYRSSIAARSVWVLPPMYPTQFGSLQKHCCASCLQERFLSLNPVRRRPHPPVSIDIVVESELLVLQYGPLGKDSHSHSIPNGPFCDVTVGVAAVVRESPDSALLGGVDKLHAVTRPI